MEKFRHVDTWVFDLDNTLYDAETGVFPRIADRMTDYVADLVGVSPEKALEMRQRYWKEHGTTLHGLMQEHKVDPVHFLAHAHDIDISDVPVCTVTDEYLARLPGRKVVFTNSSAEFAGRMLRQLGLTRHFEQIFSIEDADFLPKPHADTYHRVFSLFSVDPARACMFEDMEINLKTAADLGMTTVWFYGKNQKPFEPQPAHIHHQAEKLADWLQQTVKKT